MLAWEAEMAHKLLLLYLVQSNLLNQDIYGVLFLKKTHIFTVPKQE